MRSCVSATSQRPQHLPPQSVAPSLSRQVLMLSVSSPSRLAPSSPLDAYSFTFLLSLCLPLHLPCLSVSLLIRHLLLPLHQAPSLFSCIYLLLHLPNLSLSSPAFFPHPSTRSTYSFTFTFLRVFLCISLASKSLPCTCLLPQHLDPFTMPFNFSP